VASLSQGRTAAAQCGLFTHKSVPVIFEPPCITSLRLVNPVTYIIEAYNVLAQRCSPLLAPTLGISSYSSLTTLDCYGIDTSVPLLIEKYCPYAT